MSGTCADTPKAAASAMARARLPAAISDFEGTQPVLRHSPPILPFSTSTTGTPKAAAAAATERPPEPAPMTQMSGVNRSGMAASSCVIPGRAEGASPESITTACAYGFRAPSLRSGPGMTVAGPVRARERRVHVELEATIRASRRQARPVGGLLRGDHAVEPSADKRKYEGCRNHAKRGRRREGAEAHTGERRNEIDHPERKDRHQTQKQKVAERVGAKAFGQSLGQRTGAAHEVLADGALGDQENANRTDRRAHRRRRPTENDTEENSAGDGEKRTDRNRERDRRNVERDIRRKRREFVRGDEVAQRVVVTGERLERELAMQAHREHGDRCRDDHNERNEAPQRESPAFARG